MSVRLPVFGKLTLLMVLSFTTTNLSTSGIGEESAVTTSQIGNASHRQARVIKPKGRLLTFCVNGSGEILALCATGTEAELEIFNAAGEPVRSIHIPFAATAVNVSSDGKIFVAGDGRMARLSSTGEIEADAKTPNLGNEEELIQEATEKAKQQAEEFAKTYESQRELLRERIAEIEKKPAKELTRLDKARLKAYQRQLENLDRIIKQSAAFLDPQSILRQAKGVTSLAVSNRDVFVCCGYVQGVGYAVWRTDHDFGHAKEVKDGLRGCCGQMDIQCCGEDLVVALNTSFSVGIYNRDGEELKQFGNGDRSSVSGFGSCCNPMNVRPLADGSILTAESSIGHIKQFKPDGTFVSYIGRAKIGGGCKHCAMGHDPKTDQYYMMSQDAGHIAVLVPSASLPNGSEAEQLTARLRDEFDSRLLGTWQLGNARRQEQKSSGLLRSLGGIFGILEQVTGSGEGEEDAEEEDTGEVLAGQLFSDQNPPFQSLTFQPDGSVQVSGGAYAQFGQQWTWTPTQRTELGLEVSLEADQAELFTINIAFKEANQALFKVNFFGTQINISGKRTLTCDGKSCDETCQETNASTK